MIALPDFQDNTIFRVKVNATDENLQFTQIGGNVPNRGSFNLDHTAGQKDINIFGLSYLQRVSDATTSSALHIEPGLWLHVEASDIPPLPRTVVRQGSIPHGTSILAQGAAFDSLPGPPTIIAANIIPFLDNGTRLSSPHTDRYVPPQVILPPGAKASYVLNPNEALTDAIARQTIVNTEILDISTVESGVPKFQGGDVLNIPFVANNAKVTQFSSIFWIETVKQADNTTFLQLQYTQTIILNFDNVNWPHISVATLVKQ